MGATDIQCGRATNRHPDLHPGKPCDSFDLRKDYGSLTRAARVSRRPTLFAGGKDWLIAMTQTPESWKTGSPINRYRNPGEGYAIAAVIGGLVFFPLGIILAVKSRRKSAEADFFPVKLATVAFWGSIVWGVIWLLRLATAVFYLVVNS